LPNQVDVTLEQRASNMQRTVRLVSLLRWTAVAMHTALILSMSAVTASGDERLGTPIIAAVMMLIDLPITLLTYFTVFTVCVLSKGTPSPALIAVLFPTIFVLLGGLQWYLIASLLARGTFGFQNGMPVVSQRFGKAMILGLFLVGGCGIMPWAADLVLHPRPYTPPTTAFSGDSKDLRQSVVVPTLDTPMPKDMNVVWCGTLQLAWNRLGKDVLHGLPNVQGADVASRLNRTQFGEDDLPPDSYLAMAGFAKDGVVEKVKSGMKQRFHREVEIDPLEPNDILAYAYLEASAAFTIPFFDNRQPFRFRDFSGKTAEVTSFGIEEKHEYAYDELREQIAVLYLLRSKQNPENLDEFVIDLCRDSQPNQIVIACVPPKATLAETLDDIEKKTQEFARQPYSESYRKFGVRDVLLVPNLNWEVRHHFAELEGTDKPFLNAGFNEYHIAKAMQTIRFRLDRSGAELASEVQMPCKPMATHFVCDRPFLIIVKKRGAERPFFVMWVDNAELLCKPWL
jgi:hypothetical protein